MEGEFPPKQSLTFGAQYIYCGSFLYYEGGQYLALQKAIIFNILYN